MFPLIATQVETGVGCATERHKLAFDDGGEMGHSLAAAGSLVVIGSA